MISMPLYWLFTCFNISVFINVYLNRLALSWPLNSKLGGVYPKREITQVGKGLLGMGSRPAARGRKEREFHRIVSPHGVTQLDST